MDRIEKKIDNLQKFASVRIKGPLTINGHISGNNYSIDYGRYVRRYISTSESSGLWLV